MTGIKPNPMNGPNKFKLGIFSANADGGLALTTVPERWQAKWSDILSVAQLCDRSGFDFFLPIARWKGFGGSSNARHDCFETFTFGAALGAATERMAIFSTVHAPFVHPVFAAKALTTCDHVSQGRAGLNIVCGWNEAEFAAFGKDKPEGPYDLGDEWYDIMLKVLEGEGPFDYAGKYYSVKGAEGGPKPVQQPRPVTLSAAFSPRGREFAARTSDCIFTTFVEFEDAAVNMEDFHARAQKQSRDIGVYTANHVVCRPTQEEAEAYYERFAVKEADHAAVDNHMKGKQKSSGSHDEAAYRQHRKRFAGGAGTYPLVGTPQRIVDDMLKMSEIGFDGTGLTFVNYLHELPYFIDTVLPLMEEAGLREKFVSV